jgi:DNA (cytosine-5)-methyltransferase 1
MLLGSLFDGISGFPLAGKEFGIQTIWASEIEPNPIKVSEKHFPEIKQLGDVCKIKGSEVTPVDIITFGSPCQDLSVAGKRKGLEGQRSGLFGEAIRIIKEMREATNGRFPTYAVWENVPGAFSSNKGQDFKSVLEAFAKTEIPMPKSGRWTTAGMVRGNGRSIAWRTLDAQFWGVPQRRRRIFLVCDFGGQSAPEILFECEGMRGDIEESGKKRKETSGNIRNGVKTTGYALVGHAQYRGGGESGCLRSKGGDCAGGSETLIVNQTANTLTAEEGNRSPRGDGADNLIIKTFSFSAGQSSKARTIGFDEEKAPTIRAGNSGTNQTPTVLCIQHSIIGRKPEAGEQGSGIRDDGKSFTLDGRGQAHCVTVDCRNLNENEEISGTLQAKNQGGYSLNYINPIRKGLLVRRLTPIECERLQGFPDNWTEGVSDSARYRMLGNSLANPCAKFVLKRIKESNERG